MNEILLCGSCTSFTLKSACACGGAATSPIPPKYSPEERYADLRRKAKEPIRKEKGLL